MSAATMTEFSIAQHGVTLVYGIHEIACILNYNNKISFTWYENKDTRAEGTMIQSSLLDKTVIWPWLGFCSQHKQQCDSETCILIPL